VWCRAASDPIAAVGELLGRQVAKLSVEVDGPIPGLSSGADLGPLVALEAGSPLSLSRCRHTIQQLFATGLFGDVHIDVEPLGAEEVAVTVVLERRRRVGGIEFSGDVKLSRVNLLRELPFRRGDAYGIGLVEEGLTRLQELYRRNGYFLATVSYETEFDAESASVELVFRIDAGPQARLGSVQVDWGSGPNLLEQDELQRVLSLRPGDRFAQQGVEEALTRLRRRFRDLGYLQAEVNAKEPVYREETNRVDLEIVIRPRDRFEVEFSGWALSESERDRLPLFQRDFQGALALQATAEAIAEMVQQQGHPWARVDWRQESLGPGRQRIVFEVSPGTGYGYSGVRFVGNRRFDARTLSEQVQSRASGSAAQRTPSSREAQQNAERLRNFYQQNGFLDAQVEWRFVAEGRNAVLEFDIEEGLQWHVGRVEFVGNAELSEEVLRAQLQQKDGDVFHPVLVAVDETALQAEYQTRGYLLANVTPIVERESAGTILIRFEIEEGPRIEAGRVIIVGNRRTVPSVIRKEITVEPGTPLSYADLLQSETRLYDLGIFSRVRWKELPSFEKAERRHLFYELEEAPRFSLTYGVGYSHTVGSNASEGLRGAFSITDGNFRGRANSLTLAVRAGRRRQRGSLSYDLRRILGKAIPTTLLLSVDNENRLSTDEERRLRIRGRPYDALRLGFSAQTERRLSRRESLFFRYAFERVELDLPTDVTIPPEYFREEPNLLLSKLSVNYLNESRDSPMDPRQGFFVAGEASLALRALGSGRQYFRFLGQGRYYLPVFDDVVFVSALRLGFIEPFGSEPSPGIDPVPISEKFFAGGPNTLRGLPPDLAGPLLKDPVTGEVILVGEPGDQRAVPLGGNALVAASLEMRFPIVKFLGGAVFYDVGNVFETLSSFGQGRLSNAYGFGLALRTPVGPLRVDLAYNPSPPLLTGFRTWNVHFNLGHPF